MDPSQALSPEMVTAVESLWHDPIVPTVLDRQSEFYLMDSAAYFFDEIARIGKPDYVPNELDVLKARTKTTGISETKFKSGQLSMHMFDVGGQRSERKKWSVFASFPRLALFIDLRVIRIHCFEAVTSIIFCVALSEYDQVLLEESGQVSLGRHSGSSRSDRRAQNRMAESLVLFESVINSRWFVRTSIILFLNKIDLVRTLFLRPAPLTDVHSSKSSCPKYPSTSTFPSTQAARTSTRPPSTSSGASPSSIAPDSVYILSWSPWLGSVLH
jgi:guanine nucleotide-binding protein G(i) subunit alpha